MQRTTGAWRGEMSESALKALVSKGIAREITGRARNRLFAYERYLELLRQGTEPLP